MGWGIDASRKSGSSYAVMKERGERVEIDGVLYQNKSQADKLRIWEAQQASEQRQYDLTAGRESALRQEGYERADIVREDIQAHESQPLGDIPSMPGISGTEGGIGTLDRPEYDSRTAAAITQRMVAPQKRSLRQAYTEATASLGQIANPNIQALTLRNALEGYGMGLESAMVGARASAESEYEQRREEESWASDQQAAMMREQYSTLLSAWRAGELGRAEA